MKVNDQGYVYVTNRTRTYIKTERGKDWFLPKYGDNPKFLILNIGSIYLPDRYKGKRIRLKVEYVDEDTTEEGPGKYIEKMIKQGVKQEVNTLKKLIQDRLKNNHVRLNGKKYYIMNCNDVERILRVGK